MAAAIEQGCNLRVFGGNPQHGRAPRLRHFAASPDCTVGQFTDRAPVLAAGKAAGAEPVPDQPVGRRTIGTRGRDHEIQNLDRSLNARTRRHAPTPQLAEISASGSSAPRA